MANNPSLSGQGDGPTRILVLAQDALVTGALAGALSELDGISVVSAVEDAHVVVWDTGAERPDPAARSSAARLPPQLSAATEHTPILALVHDEAHANALLAAGARGAVLRQVGALRLAAAAVGLRYGLCVVDAELAGSSFGAAAPAPEPDATVDAGLTAREREVLTLLATGLSNKSIARRLQVSIHTVKFHVNSILSKLDADSRTAAVTSAIRRGLVTL